MIANFKAVLFWDSRWIIRLSQTVLEEANRKACHEIPFREIASESFLLADIRGGHCLRTNIQTQFSDFIGQFFVLSVYIPNCKKNIRIKTTSANISLPLTSLQRASTFFWPHYFQHNGWLARMTSGGWLYDDNIWDRKKTLKRSQSWQHCFWKRMEMNTAIKETSFRMEIANAQLENLRLYGQF